MYCDVLNVQPLFNFSDEIIKFLWGDNSALTYDQPLISGTLWRVDPLTFFGLLGQQSGTFCWRYAKEIWPWMKLKQLYKGLLVSVWLCQGACSECLCACMRTFVSGRDIYVGVLGLSIFYFLQGSLVLHVLCIMCYLCWFFQIFLKKLSLFKMVCFSPIALI